MSSQLPQPLPCHWNISSAASDSSFRVFMSHHSDSPFSWSCFTASNICSNFNILWLLSDETLRAELLFFKSYWLCYFLLCVLSADSYLVRQWIANVGVKAWIPWGYTFEPGSRKLCAHTTFLTRGGRGGGGSLSLVICSALGTRKCVDSYIVV